MNNGNYNWGIIGTGAIAKKFSKGLSYAQGAIPFAVASRKLKTAEEFANSFNFKKAYGSYRELLNDKNIDLVYIATPHQMHMENTIAALNAKKAVLCEKPFAANKQQAYEMINSAKRNDCLLMEAMWTRFIPAIRKTTELIDNDEIGEVRMITGNFGYRTCLKEEGRLFELSACGGSLMDVGIYPISLASMIFKEQPLDIQATADIGKTGVDEQSAYLLKYSKGRIALLHSAIRCETPVDAVIMGTKGQILITTPFYCSKKLILTKDGTQRVIDMPYTGNGYNFEATEIMKCLDKGLIEHPLMPLSESLAIMDTMDKIRDKINLRFPMDT